MREAMLGWMAIGALRARGVGLVGVGLLLGFFGAMSPLRAEPPASVLLPDGNVSQTLTNRGTALPVFFRALRPSTSPKGWVVDGVLSNASSAPLTGRVWLGLADRSAAAQEVVGSVAVGAVRLLEVTAKLPSEGLAPGATVALGRIQFGDGTGTPNWRAAIYQLFTNPPAGPIGLAYTRVLDELGLPLDGGVVVEVGPVAPKTRAVGRGGWISLPRTADVTGWDFQASGRITVFRAAPSGAAGEVGLVTVRLPQLEANGSTVLTPQTLPGLLPRGWSPVTVRDFAGGDLEVATGAGLAPGTAVVLSRWDPSLRAWRVAARGSAAANGAARFAAAPAGVLAAVVADDGVSLVVNVGERLPGVAVGADPVGLTAEGRVEPAVRLASRVVSEVLTAVTVDFRAAEATTSLVSGLSLLCDVRETYVLKDGTRRVLPRYCAHLTGFARPGVAGGLRATVPLRPTQLLGNEELAEALVHVEVLAPGAFRGGRLGVDGGALTDAGAALRAAAGVFQENQWAEFTVVPASVVGGIFPGTNSIQLAAEINVAGLNTGRVLDLELPPQAPNQFWVVGEAVFDATTFGFQPVARLASDAAGVVRSVEPSGDSRLPGIRASGLYLVVRVEGPQGLIAGSVRDRAGELGAGQVVRSGPWLTVTDAVGRYQLVAPSGAVAILARDPRTGDTARESLNVVDVTRPSVVDLAVARRAPSVTGTSPVSGTVDVPRVAALGVTFSQAMSPASLVPADAVELFNAAGGRIPVTLSLNLARTVLSVLPTEALPAKERLTLRLASTWTDVSGLALTGGREFNFTTETDVLQRADATLVIFEPLNGIAPMVGGPGLAEPEAPVILVNENTGMTSTVLAKVDGSFSNNIPAQVDDVLSAVLVNRNGTRNVVPAGRQIFRDGSVGLFPGGGRIEAVGEDGPVAVLVDPGTLQRRTKFRLETVPQATFVKELGEAIPEQSAVVGGFRFSTEGELLSRGAHLEFPFNPARLTLPPGVEVGNGSFAVYAVEEVEGVKVHRIVDTMSLEGGKLVTHSPPYDSLLGGVFGSYSIVFQFRTTVTVTGRVLQTTNAAVVTDANVFNFPGVPGAIVSTAGGSTAPGLRPGGFIARANGIGFYALNVPVSFDGGPVPVALKAQSFRLPGKVALKTFVPHTAAIADIANLVFTVPSASAIQDVVPPLISLINPRGVYPLDQDVSVRYRAFDNDSHPDIRGFRLVTNGPPDELHSVLLPDGAPLTPGDVVVTEGGVTDLGPLSLEKEVRFRVKKPALLLTTISALDQAGNERTQQFVLRFGLATPDSPDTLLPHDPTETVSPRVEWMSPGNDELAAQVDAITVHFSEAVQQSITNGAGVTVTGTLSGNVPITVELSSDHRTATVHPRALRPGETVTVQLSGEVKDLAGNLLSTFTGTFRTAPAMTFPVAGVNQPAGAVALGGHVFVLDRQANPTGGSGGAVRVLRMGAPAPGNAVLGSLGLPPYPRALAVVPEFSFKRSTNGPVETKPLLVVCGGLLGEGTVGQWLWVVDISDPTHPTRLGGELATVDFASAITVLRVDQGRIFLVINSAEGAVFYSVNLQAFILGNHGVYSIPGSPGEDKNRDGDFVDADETLPVPEKHSLWGQELTLPVAASRFVYDFDVLAGGSFWAATFGPQGDTPSRLQILTYAGQVVGQGDDSTGAVEFLGKTAFRVLLEENFPIATATGPITVPLVAIVAVGAELRLYDVSTDPNRPRPLRTITFPTGTPNITAFVRQGDDEFAVGAGGSTFILRRSLLGQPSPAGVPHPSIVQRFDGGPMGRSLGISPGALLAQGGSGLQIFSRPPRLQIVQFPGTNVANVKELVRVQDTNGLSALVATRLEQNFLRPAPLTSAGTNFPSAIANPPNNSFHYHLMAEADGRMGAKLQLAVESLDAAGQRLSPKGRLFAPVMLTDNASVYGIQNAQPAVTSMTAYRLSDDPKSARYNVFLSPPLLMVRELFSPATLAAVQSFPERQAVLGGEQVRVSLEHLENESQFPGLENHAGANGSVGLSHTVQAFCADFVDSGNPGDPQVSASVDGVNVQSGEFRTQSFDLLVEGRLQHLVLARVYESQSHFAGPFGRGWDFNFNMRLCEVPQGLMPADFRLPLVVFGDPTLDRVARPGDALLRNGAGALKLYRRIGPENLNLAQQPFFENDPAISEFGWTGKINGFYEPPAGDFDALFRFSDGAFVLVDPTGNRTYFSADGRLEQMVSAYSESKLVLHYRSDGRLDRVTGDRNVDFEFGYFGRANTAGFQPLDKPYPGEAQLGLIARVKAGPQNVEYFYDDNGNLVRFRGSGTEDTKYGYDPNPPHQLTSIGRGDGAGQPAQKIFYANGLVDRVDAEGTVTSFTGARSTASERRSAGSSTALVVRAGQSSSVPMDNRGRTKAVGGIPISVDEASRIASFGKAQDTTDFGYDTNNPVFRFRGNLLEVRKGSYKATSHFDGSAWNRLDHRTTPDGVVTEVQYLGDKPGSIIKQVMGGGLNVKTSHFSSWGVLTAEEHTELGKTFTKTVLFDANESLPNGMKLGNLPGWSVARSANGVGNFNLGGVSFNPTFGSDGEYQGATVGSMSVQVGYEAASGKFNSQSVSAGAGSYAESFGYDPANPNRVRTVTATDSGAPVQSSVLKYDAQQRLEKITRNGAVTTLGYSGSTLTELTSPGLHQKMTFDANGHVSVIEEQGIRSDHTFDSEGRVETITSQGGRWTLTYEIADRLKSMTVTDLATSATLLDETYTHDAMGRMRTVKSDGVTWTYDYFPDNTVRSTQINGHEVNSYDKDSSGLPTSASFLGGTLTVSYSDYEPLSGQPKRETTRYLDGTTMTEEREYDNLGRHLSTTFPGAIKTRFAYDDFGRVKTVTDPDGVVVTTTWTPGGQPLTKTFGDGTTISYQYNNDLTLRSEGDVVYDYDAHQLPSKATFTDGHTVRFEQRNSFFEPELVTLGGVAQIHAWADGRLQSVSVPSTSDLLTYSYDGLGRRTAAERNGHRVSFAYSPQHGVISETGPLGRWLHVVDPEGKVTAETYPSGWRSTFLPDAAGLPTKLDEAGIGAVSWVDLSLLKRVEFTNGITIRYEYDPALRTKRIVYEKGAVVLAGFEYGLTPGGRVQFETRLHEQVSDVYLRNTPAEGLRVTGVLFSAGTTNATNSAVSVIGMKFDPTSGELDLSAAVATGLGGRVLLPNAGDHLTYNAQGAAESGPVWVNIIGVPGRMDARFHYDGFNYLRQVERLDAQGAVSVTVDYEHDGLGRVVKRVVTGPPAICRPGEWRYAWADDRLLEEYEVVAGAPQLVRRYVYLGEELVQVQAATVPGGPLSRYVPVLNYNGSVCGYLAEDGSLVEFIRYGLYGAPEYIGLVSGVRSSRSAIGGTVLFQGAFFDEDTGLYHLGSRVLHPQFGSFLQRETSLYRESKAMYLALNGDPASFVDAGGAEAAKVAIKKMPGFWQKQLDMVCKGGLAKSKPTLFESKSAGVKFFVNKNSKGFSLASKVVGRLAGIVPSEKAQRFLEFSTVGLEALKHATTLVEEIQDWKTARMDLTKAKWAMLRSKSKMGRALDGVYDRSLGKLSKRVENYQTARQAYLETEKGFLFAKYGRINNVLNVGKAGLGLVELLVEDVLHLDENDDNLKYTGALKVAKNAIGFAKLRNSVKISQGLQDIAMRAASSLDKVEAVSTRLSVGGGYLDLPAARLGTSALCVYLAFDAGFSGGQGMMTVYYGLVDPVKAGKYRKAVKQFEANGGFGFSLLGGVAGSLGASDEFVNKLQNLADTPILPSIPNFQLNLDINPPFELYYRGLSEP